MVYDYASSTATVTDLAEPHPMHYDLCTEHAGRLSVPKGWTLTDRRMGNVVPIFPRAAS